MTRRHLLHRALASVTAGIQIPAAVGQDIATEEQRGDPDMAAETLRFDTKFIDALLNSSQKASFEPWASGFPDAFIEVARTFRGLSRENSRDQISEILSLFDLPFQTPSGFTPFCAAGVAFAAAKAFTSLSNLKTDDYNRIRVYRSILPDIEHWYFYPSVSCGDNRLVDTGKRRWVPKDASHLTPPKPGWVVYYGWDSPLVANHCGIVIKADEKGMRTLEFNTSGKINGSQVNGGAIVERDDRTYSKVLGFVPTDRRPQGVR